MVPLPNRWGNWRAWTSKLPSSPISDGQLDVRLLLGQLEGLDDPGDPVQNPLRLRLAILFTERFLGLEEVPRYRRPPPTGHRPVELPLQEMICPPRRFRQSRNAPS